VRSVAGAASGRLGERGVIALLALGGLVARLVLIRLGDGGADLQVYAYFGELVGAGRNPYADAPPGGAIDPSYSDQMPLEFLLFGGLLALYRSPEAIRIFLALADVGVILLVGLAFPRPRSWRVAFAAFYAFSPFLLLSWTAFAEDKTFVFALIVLVIIGVEAGRPVLGWAAAAALTAVKLFGAFLVPPLVLHGLRTLPRRRLALLVAGFAVVLALAHLPFFPDGLRIYDLRSARTGIDPPIHASPTQLLAAVGLYAPAVARFGIPLCFAAVYLLTLTRRVTPSEGVALSVLAAFLLLPDQAANRILLVSLPLLLVLRATRGRWLALWGASALSAVALYAQVRGVPELGLPGWAPVADATRALFGPYGSVRHVVWMNLTFALVLGFFVSDKLRGQGLPSPSAHGRGEEGAALPA